LLIRCHVSFPGVKKQDFRVILALGKAATLEGPILSLANVSKYFGGLAAVSRLSFDVQSGEMLGLMGPNGAGKTTVLNIISGEYRPDTGSIRFKGENICNLAPHRISHLGIARTFQIPQPFVNLTALQNVAVAARFAGGLDKTTAESEAVKILDIVGLSDKKDVLAKDLLVVTLKRLELARALAAKPTLLLLDEVAAGLTDTEIPQLLDVLKKVHDMGITVMLIEHVMKVMMAAVDRIITMHEGMKIAEGTPKEIMEDKKVIQAYFG
jgi:branched-chain amino acid transport system ATP-binding protein